MRWISAENAPSSSNFNESPATPFSDFRFMADVHHDFASGRSHRHRSEDSTKGVPQSAGPSDSRSLAGMVDGGEALELHSLRFCDGQCG